MRPTKRKTSTRKTPNRSQLNIGLKPELRKRLEKVCEDNDELNPTTLARVGLRHTLEQIEAGTHAIVNGRLQPIAH